MTLKIKTVGKAENLQIDRNQKNTLEQPMSPK